MKLLAVLVLATFAAMVAACAAPAPTLPPSPTPEPVTFSTPTPIPSPTITLVRGTLAPAPPGSIVGAMTRTKSAPRYRVTLTLTVKQGIATSFSLDLKGEVNGDDEHYNYALGGEQIEFINARALYFAKGGKSLGFPSTTKWYALPADVADAARPPFSAEDLLTSFIAQIPKENFQPSIRESLDGIACQVYRYIPKNLNEAGIANILSENESNALGALDPSEMKLWICDDGMLHQLTVDANGHNPRRTTDKGSAKLQLHFWDFQNTSIKIDPPPNAEKFQSVSPTP